MTRTLYRLLLVYPVGRWMQKVWRRRGWHMNQDGSHSPVEDNEFWDREADDCIGWLFKLC